MANFFKNIFGTADENEGFVDYEEDSYDTSSNAVTNTEASYSDYGDSRGSSSYGSSRYINLRSSGSNSAKLKILVPKSYEDVMSEAVDLLRDDTIVIINLNGISAEISMRIVDFMTGVTAAFEGRIKRVDNECYACAPKNVEWVGSIED